MVALLNNRRHSHFGNVAEKSTDCRALGASAASIQLKQGAKWMDN